MADIALLDRPSGTADAAETAHAAGAETATDHLVLEALRQGDEAAFAALVERYHPAMVRAAALYVPNRQVAEEIAQDAWLAVLRGLDRFEGRCSLKTWIFHILANRARTQGERERRAIPFSALAPMDGDADEPAVGPARFFGPDHPERPGRWATPPRRWDGGPEERLLSRETRAVIQQVIDALPPRQREVVTLRDIEGWTPAEVRGLLGLGETNQRVPLHRARSKVRRALEAYFGANRTGRIA